MIISKLQINNYENFLKRLADQDNTDNTIYLKCKFLKIREALKSEIEDISRKTDEIIYKYCEKDENGKPVFSENNEISVDPKAQEELNRLLLEKVNIECEYSFTPDELIPLNLDWGDIEVLLPFIRIKRG